MSGTDVIKKAAREPADESFSVVVVGLGEAVVVSAMSWTMITPCIPSWQ